MPINYYPVPENNNRPSKKTCLPVSISFMSVAEPIVRDCLKHNTQIDKHS